MPGTSNANFLVEVDGVSVLEATECEIGGVKHEPFKLSVGNRPNPYLGRNKFEVEEVKIKGAYALNSQGQELFQGFNDYIRGLNIQKLSMRVIQLGEDGFSTEAVHEFIECVPTAFQPEGKKADSKDAAYFTISFKPTDYVEY